MTSWGDALATAAVVVGVMIRRQTPEKMWDTIRTYKKKHVFFLPGKVKRVLLRTAVGKTSVLLLVMTV